MRCRESRYKQQPRRVPLTLTVTLTLTPPAAGCQPHEAGRVQRQQEGHRFLQEEEAEKAEARAGNGQAAGQAWPGREPRIICRGAASTRPSIICGEAVFEASGSFCEDAKHLNVCSTALIGNYAGALPDLSDYQAGRRDGGRLRTIQYNDMFCAHQVFIFQTVKAILSSTI